MRPIWRRFWLKGNPDMKSPAQNGFTLMELLMSIVFAAVLLALASPSFVEFNQNRRITNQANEFVSSLALARSEALKRVSRVTVCRANSTGTACAGAGNWGDGWIVFLDPDNSGTRGGGEQILKVVSALPFSNDLDGSSNVAAYVSYTSSGHSKTTAGAFQSGSFVLCDERGATKGRTISINVTGRVRVESAAPSSCTV